MLTDNIMAGNFFENEAEKAAYGAIGVIEKILVGHGYFDSAIKGIKECIKESVYSREASNCLLVGEGGMGKTSVARIFLTSMKKEVVIENDMEISTVPAFYTSFKSARNLSALTTDILKQLNDPHPTAGTLGDKAARVLELLKKCRTVIVFIDEMHDLEGFDKRNFSKMERFFKWVKELCNGCGPVICLMGISSCYDIFDKKPEMARRFKHKFLLESLKPGIATEPGLLQPFLDSVCREIVARTPVDAFPPVDEYLNALRVYVATSGSPDFIMALLKKAVLRTLLDGRTVVEVEDFANAWASGCLDAASIIKTNPFHASQAEIAAAIRRRNA